VDKDYIAFVHLEDRDGRVWGQSDNQPAHNYYPTSLWDTGEVVKDEHLLGVLRQTPPGVYLIKAGMYEHLAPQPLDLVEADGRRQYGSLSLGQVQVEAAWSSYVPIVLQE
jgi:hypothetical protein